VYGVKMADQVTSSDDDGIEWTQAISQNGRRFEIGIKKSEHSKERPSEVATEEENQVLMTDPQGRASDWTKVNWRVGDDTWNDTTGSISSIITRYKLYYNGFPNIYSYTLEFSNKLYSEFFFMDESGDKYQVVTWRDGDHWLKYNSDKPTIVSVRSLRWGESL